MKQRRVVLLAFCIMTLIASVCAFSACYVFSKPDRKDDPEKTESNKIFTVEDSTITGLTEYGKTLSEIEIPEKIDGKDMTSIGGGAFFGCSGLTGVTIPDRVTSIGDRAFSYCSGLTSVTMPEGVTSIGDSAFWNCSGLTEIHYNGKIEQWKAIQKEYSWDYDTGNYTVYCTDGNLSKDEA